MSHQYLTGLDFDWATLGTQIHFDLKQFYCIVGCTFSVIVLLEVEQFFPSRTTPSIRSIHPAINSENVPLNAGDSSLILVPPGFAVATGLLSFTQF